MLVLHAKIKIR